MGTKHSEDVEREEKKNDNVDTIPTGSSPAELEAGQDVVVLKFR